MRAGIVVGSLVLSVVGWGRAVAAGSLDDVAPEPEPAPVVVAVADTTPPPAEAPAPVRARRHYAHFHAAPAATP